MQETQKTIVEWSVDTFGYPTNVIVMLDRMLKEVKELEALKEGCMVNGDLNYDKIADECADIYITMCNLMGTMGYNLQACIDHKMQINRGRRWRKHGDGTGQHIKEE